MRPGAGLNAFISYLKDFFRTISSRAILITVLFVAALISLNYTLGIETRIRALRPWPLSLLGFFLFYAFVFWGAWAIQWKCGHSRRRTNARLADGNAEPGHGYGRPWRILLLIAPLFFAFKMVHWDLSFLVPSGWPYPWGQYTLVILQLPAKLLALIMMLAVCRSMLHNGGSESLKKAGGAGDGSPEAGSGLFGFTGRGFAAKPYFLILIGLIPLIALASTQHDFLLTYPKVKNIAFINGYAQPAWPWKLLYELSYGLDFVSIELFFRGFLVIGLAPWAGKEVILPMAAFYCTIHFGKPLGECISSFFGGMALGVIAWRTRSILGGLIVHLGLAWLMEIGGWVGAGIWPA
ncbi:MAG TPA: CPBP family intramembrane glutamic endopeptidase [Puia sp.]|nr:CPBP family intramembrane glutamic endopeptidase [Puia sp.]